MDAESLPQQRDPEAVRCDRDHLDQLRAPDSDVAVPSNPAALESVAALLAHARRS